MPRSIRLLSPWRWQTTIGHERANISRTTTTAGRERKMTTIGKAEKSVPRIRIIRKFFSMWEILSHYGAPHQQGAPPLLFQLMRLTARLDVWEVQPTSSCFSFSFKYSHILLYSFAGQSSELGSSLKPTTLTLDNIKEEEDGGQPRPNRNDQKKKWILLLLLLLIHKIIEPLTFGHWTGRLDSYFRLRSTATWEIQGYNRRRRS